MGVHARACQGLRPRRSVGYLQPVVGADRARRFHGDAWGFLSFRGLREGRWAYSTSIGRSQSVQMGAPTTANSS